MSKTKLIYFTEYDENYESAKWIHETIKGLNTFFKVNGHKTSPYYINYNPGSLSAHFAEDKTGIQINIIRARSPLKESNGLYTYRNQYNLIIQEADPKKTASEYISTIRDSVQRILQTEMEKSWSKAGIGSPV